MSEKVTVKVERSVLHLPAIALRGLVVFPNNLLHFEVGREKSIAAVEWAVSNNSDVFLVAQKEMKVEDPKAADLYTYGVVAEVKQVMRVSDDLVRILVEGKYRARLSEMEDDGSFLLATVRPAPVRMAKPEELPEADVLVRNVKKSFDDLLALNPHIGKDVVFAITTSTDAAFLSEYIPANLLFRFEDKQAILDEGTLMGRLHLLIEKMHRERRMLEIDKEIAQKVDEAMDKNQRDYYLHEQLHMISEELGEDDDTTAEAEEYRRKITALHLDEDREKKLLKEVDRLSKMQSSNQEGTVIRTYLDTCLDLPWNTFTEDDLDIAKAQRVLDRDHYGLKKVKDRILEVLAVRKLAPDVKGQIICLVGPPGVGKTSIARSIAESLNRKYVRISLGGVRDEAEIRGHRRTYIGAMPGKIINAMISAKSSNPLMLLDEIDKLAGDFRGDPAAALLEALDPEQNSTFNDHFIDMSFDLSHVLFITTANDLSAIPGPLRDRMDVIELPSYTRWKSTTSPGSIWSPSSWILRPDRQGHLLPERPLRHHRRLHPRGRRPQSGAHHHQRPAQVRPEDRFRRGGECLCHRHQPRKAAGTPHGQARVPQPHQRHRHRQRSGLDQHRRRDPAHRGAGHRQRQRQDHRHRFSGRRDEGERPAGHHLCPRPCRRVRHRLRAPQEVRPAHPRPGGCSPQRRPLCRRHPDHGSHLLPVRHPGAGRCGHDRRDHPPRQCAAHRRPPREEYGRLPRGMKTVLIPKDNVSDLYEVDDEVKKNIEFLPMSNLSQVLAAALLKPKTVSAGHPRTRKVKPAEAAALPQTAEKPQPGAVC